MTMARSRGMPDSKTQRRWLVLAAAISLTVTAILVSLHLRESHMSGRGANASGLAQD
jgi:hypothetical protein